MRDELVERFVRELEAVGGVVYRSDSAAQARDAVLRILDEHQAKRVIRGNTAAMKDLTIDAALADAGMEVTVADLGDEAKRDALREASFVADAGITSVDYAVAETGTLALLTRRGQGRCVSLLPPVHIAVLRADAIVLELAALFERLTADGEMPSALTFVTGPSRTGDIELVLTMGVHGPKELHLVLVS